MDRRTLLAILAGAVTFVVATAKYKSMSSEQHAMITRVDKQTQINLQAIANAEQIVKHMIERGDIKSVDDLSEALSAEVDFQKIALRET